MPKGAEGELDPRISEDYEGVRYAKDYSVEYQDRWFNLMIGLMENDGPVLDNGCGVGRLAMFIPKGRLVGIDISPSMIEKAKKRMACSVGDSQDLPFEDGEFGSVFCRGVLHHLENPEKGVDEMYRVLKKGGEAIIAEPIETFFNTIPRELTNKHDHFSSLHKDFRESELIELLEKRFRIAKRLNFGYLAYPLLGFPDVVNPFDFVPFKSFSKNLLFALDDALSRAPVIRKQSWGVIVRGVKE